MERSFSDEKYRSPKTAARSTAQRLIGGFSITAADECNRTSVYNPEKHHPFPRAIELKPKRFAITAILFEQVANKVLVGAGTEVRLPALSAVRDDTRGHSFQGSPNFTDSDTPFLRLTDDWTRVDYSQAIQEVIEMPSNTPYIESYHEIIEDIATDPNTEDSYCLTDNGCDELHIRLNPANSFETEISGYFLLKWGLELVPRDLYPEAEDRRQFLLHNIDFFHKLSELEIGHAQKYFMDKWNDLTLTAAQAGVMLRKDHNGQYELALSEREKRPEKIYGQPIGCPMGFNLDPATKEQDDSQERGTHTSDIERFLTAYVNEAYDRNLL